jgi:hypothetical protein
VILNKAKETLDAFWVEIGADNYNHLGINELEELLKRIEKFHKLVLPLSERSKAFSLIETDCKAQMSLIIMRQNFLATGKYF